MNRDLLVDIVKAVALFLMIAGTSLMAVALVGCKKDAGVLAERAPDGKAMVEGCVWLTTSVDGAAFCSDGRICTNNNGHGPWKCVQFMRSTTPTPLCPAQKVELAP